LADKHICRLRDCKMVAPSPKELKQPPSENKVHSSGEQSTSDNGDSAEPTEPGEEDREQSVAENPSPPKESYIYSHQETKILRDAIKTLAQARPFRLDPRTVRSLMFRYQLARDICLQQTGKTVSNWTDENAKDLVHAIITSDTLKSMDGYDPNIIRIVQQVRLAIRFAPIQDSKQ
jgi:hypothetical protein